MRKSWLPTIKFLLAAVFVANTASPAEAALILTIDKYTTDALSFTISGTFDSDTVGAAPGYLALKNDWSNNTGVHTEMFSGMPAVLTSTVAFGGVLAPTQVAYHDHLQYGDSVFWRNPNEVSSPFLSGTAVSGSVTLFGVGAFNPADAATLQLISGWNSSTADWVRLEATAVTGVLEMKDDKHPILDKTPVPEPTSMLLLATGLLGAGLGRWRQKRA